MGKRKSIDFPFDSTLVILPRALAPYFGEICFWDGEVLAFLEGKALAEDKRNALGESRWGFGRHVLFF
jgi:hypothetical protein